MKGKSLDEQFGPKWSVYYRVLPPKVGKNHYRRNIHFKSRFIRFRKERKFYSTSQLTSYPFDKLS